MPECPPPQGKGGKATRRPFRQPYRKGSRPSAPPHEPGPGRRPSLLAQAGPTRLGRGSRQGARGKLSSSLLGEEAAAVRGGEKAAAPYLESCLPPRSWRQAPSSSPRGCSPSKHKGTASRNLPGAARLQRGHPSVRHPGTPPDEFDWGTGRGEAAHTGLALQLCSVSTSKEPRGTILNLSQRIKALPAGD